MSTLQEICKRKYPTIKAFAEALGVSPSTAGAWLRGDHAFWAPSFDKAWQMRTLLDLTAPQYYEALAESRKQDAQRKKQQAKKKR